MIWWALGFGFVLGSFGRDVVTRLHGIYWFRRWERESREAAARFAGCPHERTVLVDTGLGPTTKKCLKCWGLLDERGPCPGKWYPNTAPPPASP